MSKFENDQAEIKYLTDRVKELESTIKIMIWNSYHYRLEEIYHYFDKNGIKQTANKFKMPMIDVINFIIECDDNECGVASAYDYNECYKEVYGDSIDSEDSNKIEV